MKILDLSAGNRAIWFDKKHTNTTYCDVRPEVKPDVVCDTKKLPFENNIFGLIVFDPPHVNFGKNSNMSISYGHFTTEQIRQTIIETSKEAHRVSRIDSLMAFKWNDHDQKLEKILALMPDWEPLFGHKTKDGPGSQTYWVMLKRKSV